MKSNFYFVKKFKSFFLLLLSALGFSLGLLLARITGNNELLPVILNFQSTVVLLSFILQLGFRASLRIHLYHNRSRLVKLCEEFLYRMLLFCAFIGFFLELYFDIKIYIASSAALAYITLKLTLSVARENLRKQFFYTILNFYLCFSGAVFFLVVNDIGSASLLIETSAFITLALFCRKTVGSITRKNIIYSILYRAQSYQLGSGVISLIVFILTQSMITTYTNDIVMVAFSDAQIASGFISLLIGQCLLLFEVKLYKNNGARIHLFFTLMLLQFIVVFILAISMHNFYLVDFYLFFVVNFILTSRVLLGYLVQYVIQGREYLNMLCTALLLYFCVYYFLYLKENVYVHILPVLTFIFVGTYLLIKEKKNAP